MAHVQRKCARCRKSVEDGRRTCPECGSRNVRYVARYVDLDGAERSESFARRQDAEDRLEDIGTSKRHGDYVDPALARQRAGDVLEAWLARRSLRLKPKTLAGYRSLLDSRILPAFGRREVGAISATDVDEWIAGMVADGLSPSRVRQAVGLLSQVLDAAARDRAIGRNPCHGAERPPLRRQEAPWLVPAQVEAIALEARAPYDLAIRTLGTVGLRFGELAALRQRSVDPLRRRIRVEASLAELGGELIFGPPKSHATRLVPLTTTLAEAYARRLKDLDDDPDALVFTSPRGAPPRYSNFRSTVWVPALERLSYGDSIIGADGRPRFRPAFGVHAMRHSAAAAMIHAGASPKSVQSILGHANAAFTLTVYAHLFDDDLDAVAEGLDRVVAVPKTGPIRDRDGMATVLAFPT